MGVPRWGEARRHTRSATFASDVDAVADLPVSAALLATLPKSQVDHVRLELRSCLGAGRRPRRRLGLGPRGARGDCGERRGPNCTRPSSMGARVRETGRAHRFEARHVDRATRLLTSEPSPHPKAGCAAGDAANWEPIARHRRRRVNAPHNRRVPSSDEQLHQSRYVLCSLGQRRLWLAQTRGKRSQSAGITRGAGAAQHGSECLVMRRIRSM